jgi:hypothetical protein
MTVKITKPALNLREELADLRKPSGIAGEAVLRADSVQEQRDLIGAGRKNLIINGGFDVWQRGTSSSTKGNYTADRWKHHFYSSGSITTTKQASGLVDFPNCVRVQRPSGTTGTHDLCLNYAMESQDCSRLVGKTLTLSYWMRKGSDFAGHTMRAVLMFGTGVDDYINYDYFATHRVSSYSNGAIRRYITPTSNWERITETYQVHADTTQIGVAFASDYDSTSGTAGANDYIEITGVQLELGSVATEFEHRSYGEELALCQRYTFVLDGQSSYYERYASNWGDSVNQCICHIWFPAEMRTTPSLTSVNISSSTIQVHSYTDNGGRTFNGPFALGESSGKQAYMHFSTASATRGGTGMWRWIGTPDARLIFDAEL